MGDFTTLSIDLGSTIGYCVGRNGVIVQSGEVTLYAKDTHPGHRWLRFQNWLFEISQSIGKVDEILFEDIMFFGKNGVLACRVYSGLLAVLQLFSLGNNIRISALTPSQVKKDFTGSGAAKKTEVCDVAMRLGWRNGMEGTDRNNNEADAIALYWVVCSRRGLQPSFVQT